MQIPKLWASCLTLAIVIAFFQIPSLVLVLVSKQWLTMIEVPKQHHLVIAFTNWTNPIIMLVLAFLETSLSNWSPSTKPTSTVFALYLNSSSGQTTPVSASLLLCATQTLLLIIRCLSCKVTLRVRLFFSWVFVWFLWIFGCLVWSLTSRVLSRCRSFGLAWSVHWVEKNAELPRGSIVCGWWGGIQISFKGLLVWIVTFRKVVVHQQVAILVWISPPKTQSCSSLYLL